MGSTRSDREGMGYGGTGGRASCAVDGSGGVIWHGKATTERGSMCGPKSKYVGGSKCREKSFYRSGGLARSAPDIDPDGRIERVSA